MKSSSPKRMQKHFNTLQVFATLSLVVISAKPAISSPFLSASSTDANHTRKEELVTLSDLHDAGIALERIKQEAINIYVESTRTTITDASQIDVHDPDSIPAASKGGTPEPPRKDWLVFYVNSLEPIIQLLNYDVDEAKGDGSLVVNGATPKGQWGPLWLDWANHVKSMNDHLSTMVPLFEEAEKNDKAIANQAVSIYNEVTWLEKIRKQAAKLVVESVP
jgi:hypothetical protein